MYEKKYVSKRLRRVAVAIGAGISATVIGVFSIVAFLGRFVGTFTVTLDNANVSLALSTSSSFDRQESFLHIADLPSYSETTFTSLPNAEVLDNEETSYLNGANYTPEGLINNLSYFKYTFFVKNVGTVTARYELKLKILDSTPSTDSHPRYLDDTLRAMLYENDAASSEHNYTVYAKPRAIAYVSGGGEVIYKEPISVQESDVSPTLEFQGYAEMFESDKVIATTFTESFVQDAVKRYTLVTWLEGYDAQSSPFEGAPKDAKIRIGVEINAYEN